MTPESYMRRYHTDCTCNDTSVPVPTAEELFPSCVLTANTMSECNNSDSSSLPLPCCCKASMVEALGLLCNTELADLVNFDSFFFLTDSLTVGGYITTPTTGNADNISAADASFRRFSPRSCDLIDVTGTAYFITPGTENSTLQNAEQLNLCTVKAIVFGLADLPDCPDDCPDATYRRAVRTIRRTIRTNGGETSACSSAADTQVCNSCCCNSGVLTELATRNLSRLATLTAGELVLQNVTVLGSIGSVLILTDSTLERFYFICASQIETLG